VKHKIEDDVNININIPTEDVERVIDKTTDAVIKIITAVTIAHICKSMFNSRKGL
jgi:hypothetical protein